MIFIPEVGRRIEELYPRYEAGELGKAEFMELLGLLNEVVREARRARSDHLEAFPRELLPADYPLSEVVPEEFLVSLFSKKIEITSKLFFKDHVLGAGDYGYENSNTEEGTEFGESLKAWIERSKEVVRSIIIGDFSQRSDHQRRVDNIFRDNGRTFEKLLYMNYLWQKPHMDWLLGEGGRHKNKGYLDILLKPEVQAEEERLSREFDFDNPWGDLEERIESQIKHEGTDDPLRMSFVIRDEAAIAATREITRRYKMPTKINPTFDEPTSYDPDYKPPEARRSIDKKKFVEIALDEWDNGGYNDQFESIEKLIEWLEVELLGISLIEIDNNLKGYESFEPNLIAYIFGTKSTRCRLIDRMKAINDHINRSEGRERFSLSIAEENGKNNKGGCLDEHLVEPTMIDIVEVDQTENDVDGRNQAMIPKLLESLSDKESVVFGLLMECAGDSTRDPIKESAEILGCSERTIYNYRKSIMEKALKIKSLGLSTDP